MERVNNFAGQNAFVDGSIIAHEGDRDEVIHSPVLELYGGSAYPLKGNSRVKELPHGLQDENIFEGIGSLRARAARSAYGGSKQASAGPVVELTVGDTGYNVGHGIPITEAIALRVFKRAAEEHGLPCYGFMGFGAY